MKKLFGFVTLGVIVVGILALVSPTPVMAAKGPKCKNGHVCTIESDWIPVCPPCYYWQYCGPQCGCRPIPGCHL